MHVPGQTKHHNTAKVLLGIAPQGVSKCWEGPVSDKYLTGNQEILFQLKGGGGGVGFDIADSFATMSSLHFCTYKR